jgi:hypothetical protein
MRAAKVLAVLAIAALGIGSFSAVAAAGKPLKLKTIVDFCVWTSAELPNSCEPHGQNPTFDKSGLVSAEGVTAGHVTSACLRRSMSLQLLDTNGVVLTTLDSSTSSARGLWKLSGQFPTTVPAGTNYVRVKAKKKTVGKVVAVGDHREGRDVCLAAVSPKVAIPAV